MTGIEETTNELIYSRFKTQPVKEPAGYTYAAETRFTKDEAKQLRQEVKDLGWYKSRNGERGIGVGHYVYRHPETPLELNLYFGPGMVRDTAFFYRRGS